MCRTYKRFPKIRIRNRGCGRASNKGHDDRGVGGTFDSEKAAEICDWEGDATCFKRWDDEMKTAILEKQIKIPDVKA